MESPQCCVELDGRLHDPTTDERPLVCERQSLQHVHIHRASLPCGKAPWRGEDVGSAAAMSHAWSEISRSLDDRLAFGCGCVLGGTTRLSEVD
jgi:hypothetical protein